MIAWIVVSTTCFFMGSDGWMTSMPKSQGMVKKPDQICREVVRYSTSPVIPSEYETVYRVVREDTKTIKQILDELEVETEKLKKEYQAEVDRINREYEAKERNRRSAPYKRCLHEWRFGRCVKCGIW